MWRRCRVQKLDGNVEDQAKSVADLAEDGWADVSMYLLNASNRDSPNVLTLCGRSAPQSILAVGFDGDLRREGSDCGGQRHNLDHVWLRIEDALCGDNHCGMAEPGFLAFGKSEIEVYNITRGQHRANQLRPA